MMFNVNVMLNLRYVLSLTHPLELKAVKGAEKNVIQTSMIQMQFPSALFSPPFPTYSPLPENYQLAHYLMRAPYTYAFPLRVPQALLDEPVLERVLWVTSAAAALGH